MTENIVRIEKNRGYVNGNCGRCESYVSGSLENLSLVSREIRETFKKNLIIEPQESRLLEVNFVSNIYIGDGYQALRDLKECLETSYPIMVDLDDEYCLNYLSQKQQLD